MDNTIQGQGYIESLASFQNQNGGTVDANVSGGTLEIYGPPTTNTGTFEAQAGATLNLVNTTLTNFAAGTLTGGTYEVYSGTLSFYNGGYSNDIVTNAANILLGGTSGAPSIIDQNGNNALAQFATNAAAGNFTIQNGVSVTTASSDFNNAGTINLLPGTLNVEGNYTQTSGGALGIGLGGLTAGTQFGQLNATGTATLAGTFNVSSVSSYQPLPGNMYQVVNFASKTGNFNTYNGLQIGTTLLTATFLPANNPTNLTLNGVTTTTLTSIAVTPANPSIAPGTTEQFTATGTYSDNSTEDLTSQVTWASANTSVATINSTGLATGVAMGTSTITATLGTSPARQL